VKSPRAWTRYLLLAVLAACPLTAHASPDNTLFTTLLRDHVVGNRLDYAGLKKNQARLDAYLDILSVEDPDGLDRDARFAFYLNAYNAWTLKLILTRYPNLDSIKELGTLFSSPWKLKIVRLKQGVLTLDDVEHQILRPTFNDARVHFAVNCASISCPPLRNQPFEPDRLDAQLDDAVRDFINDPKANYLDNDTLYLSKIFDWYAADFGGEQGVIDFVITHAAPDLKNRLQDRRGAIRVKYLDYDWALNDAKP